MTWNPSPLSSGALRDLLGITRALYRAATDEEPRDASRLAALEELGRTLQAVLRASRTHPGTIVHDQPRAAPERATRALLEFVGESMILDRSLQRPRDGSCVRDPIPE